MDHKSLHCRRMSSRPPSRDPVLNIFSLAWIPAFAGMTSQVEQSLCAKFLPIFLIKWILVLFCPTGVAAIRDPFSLPSASKTEKAKQDITLAGIVNSGIKQCVILVHGANRAVVEVGKSFAGYKLLSIGKNFVVVSRGKNQKKIFIE